MASVVYFLDNRGRPLLHRDYKWDIPSTAVEKFPILLLEKSSNGDAVGSLEDGSTVPVLNSDGVHYIYLMHKNLYILALTREDTNAFAILCYLDSLVRVLEGYLKSLEEESIRDNFSIIYELLDEMMDYGVPQITDQKILKEYITQESFTLKTMFRPSGSKKKPGSTTVFKERMAPSAVTNAISWRSSGIVHKKNEAYLDVVESIDMLINPKNQILSSEIHGEIKLRSTLSGMPELVLGLNEKFMNSCINAVKGLPPIDNTKKSIEVEDVKFHQCVRLGKFESEKMISFIPPDGECNLFSYRVHSSTLKPMFLIDYKVRNHSNTRLEIMVKVRANFKSRISARKLEIRVPVPRDVDSPKYHYNKGSLKYLPNESVILWKFHKIDGAKEYVMIAELLLPSVADELELNKFRKIPLNLKFEMQGFVTSGLQVKYLKIREPKMNYQSYPYVRYITKSGDHYEVRVK
ncbi:hypothetical protein FOA43_002672 [Brettanomyces nanus]|uniref:MHD domain-containing protein n=1 Tax=Eeniella nana TaxID=13502 RepID=A0A875RPP7_EENNA|nr:uncharacterized protein FOA43_002672 [Brettanomyces nanus]QPG75320.1 hypothetical protein FOA43_002672 [Brettanomyces nanus]